MCNKFEVFMFIFDKDIEATLKYWCFYWFIGYGLFNNQIYHQTKGWTTCSASSRIMSNMFEVSKFIFDKEIEETFGLSTLLPRSLNMTRTQNQVTNMNVCWILNVKLISPRYIFVWNSLQTRGPIRVKGLWRVESKPSCRELFFHFLMSKCSSKQCQSRYLS